MSRKGEPSTTAAKDQRPILARVRSQETAVRVLARAVSSARVHHAYLFTGPAGTGKELAALGLAQALVCERRADGESTACNACSACLRAEVTTEGVTRHPDIVFVERGLYPPGAIGRRTPESQDISIDQIRTVVLSRAAFGPHEGRAKVFIIRRAEELGVSAANALLKTLEEPGDRTHFVLLTSQPGDLLPTIRSRTMEVRFGSLPEDVVRDLLVLRGLDDELAAKAAALSSGSMEEALLCADPELLAVRDAFVARVLDGIAAGERGKGYEIAEGAKKDKAKLELDLVALGLALHKKLRASAAGPNARNIAHAFADVMQAREDLLRNNAPQLVVETLYVKLRDTLRLAP